MPKLLGTLIIVGFGGRLRDYVDGLGLESAFASARQTIGILGIAEAQLACRKFGWVADNSPETRSNTGERRLRAAYGAAVLLAPKVSDPGWSSSCSIEDAKSGFYMLGLAVDRDQEGEGVVFYEMCAADPETDAKPLQVYRALTGGVFRRAVETKRKANADNRDKNIVQVKLNEFIWGEDAEAVGGPASKGLDPYFLVNQKIEESYQQELARVADTPYQSQEAEQTASLAKRLLDTSNRNYGSHLRFLTDGGPGCRLVGHLLFREGLETWLAQHPLIQAAAKAA